MRSVTLRSPAKLNLLLKVINKRPDGYHNLETLFERIDLCDHLEFNGKKTGDIRIFCDHPQMPKGSRNLVYRVAKFLKEEYKIKEGVDVKIEKRIPIAAGLAGGSSNAATTLLALNKIWKLSLSRKKMIEYAQIFGSDIPFFLYNCSWGLGVNRGDLIRPVSIPTKLWHILVVPCVKMYSREVFTSLNLQLTKPNDNVNILIRYLNKNNITKVGRLLSNDLESSIVQIRPKLLNVKKKISAFHLKGVAFSGSGPAVFGLTESRKQAENLKAILSRQYKQVFAVRTL